MKIKSCYSLFVLLFLISGIFCTSCTQKLIKPSAFAPNTDIENLMQEALRLYYLGRLPEASQKLEIVAKIIPEDPPTWSAVILYSMLAFFREKSADTARAYVTYEVVEDLLGRVKGTSPESEVLATRLLQYARQLKGQDRLQLLDRFLPLASKAQGKAGEALTVYMIADVYVSLGKWTDAYEKAKEAITLSREAGQLNLEVQSLLALSISCIFLNRVKEAESPLEEILPRIQGDSILKANVLAQFGLVHAALGREDRSARALQEANNLIDSLGTTDLVARHHLKSAFAYGLLRKMGMSIKETKIALGIFEKLNDEASVATTEGIIAQFYFETDDFEEANQHASRATEIYNRLGNRIEEAKNLRLLGKSWWALNKIDDALKALEKAALIQVDEKDRDGVLETLWTAVSLLKSAGRIGDSRLVLLMGLNTHTSIFIGDVEGERKIRWELAKVCDELGLYSEASEQFSKVLIIYDQLTDKKGKVFTLLEMAQIFAKLNDFQNRVIALYSAETLGAEIDDPFIKLIILNQTAMFFAEFGDNVEALGRYLESIEVSRLISKESESIQLALVGSFYSRLGEHAKALKYFEEELKIAKEIGDQIVIARCLTSIGFCYLDMRRYDDAIGSAREAIQIISSMKKPMIQGVDKFIASKLLGLALQYQGKYEDALKVNQEQLKIAEKSGKPVDIKDVNNEIGFIYLRMGQYTEAIEKFKMAIQITELLRGNMGYEEQKMGFLSKHLSPYDGIIHAFFELSRKTSFKENQLAEEALSFAEKNKGRIWAEQFSKTRAELIQETVPLDIRNEEKELFNKFIIADQEYKNTSTRLGVSPEELHEKEKVLKMAIEKSSSFMEKVRRQYPRYALLRYYIDRPLQLNELTVKDGETLILYKVTLDWVYAWVVRRIHDQPKILKFTKLPYKTFEIAITIDKLLSPFRIGKYEKFDTKISNELFHKILKPVLEGVDASNRLIIIPDGMLNLVPFEVLVTGTGCDNGVKTTCFLGDQFIINYYPSAAILTFNRETTPQALPPIGSLFAVADPIYGVEDERLDQTQVSLLLESEKKQESNSILKTSGIQKRAQVQGYNFKRLKHTGVEVQKILDTLRNSLGNKEVLVGFDASEDRIKSRDLVQYRYLHFAVHGILAYDLPNLKEPALVLGIYPLESKEDGFLTVSEIYGLKLNADLVTLSACETGLGPRVQGEGVVGLSRAFMTVGARSVLVSLWEVADESTALLMEEFYRLLAQGMDKVEALKKAKEYLRMKGYKNPYFWAPFILIGD